MPQQTKTPAAVTVAATWTELLRIVLGGKVARANIELENAGDTNALTDFKVQARDHEDGEWYDYLSGAQIVATARPESLAAEAITHLRVGVVAVNAIRLMAKSASGTTANAKATVGDGGGSAHVDALWDVLGDSTVDVDTTAGGKSLATLMGAALSADLKRLALVPASGGVYRSKAGTPSASTPEVPAVLTLLVNKTTADTYKFITASGTVAMQVIQEG